MINFKPDSVAANKNNLTREELIKKLTEQEDLNELLKGCIMELTAVVFAADPTE